MNALAPATHRLFHWLKALGVPRGLLAALCSLAVGLVGLDVAPCGCGDGAAAEGPPPAAKRATVVSMPEEVSRRLSRLVAVGRLDDGRTLAARAEVVWPHDPHVLDAVARFRQADREA